MFTQLANKTENVKLQLFMLNEIGFANCKLLLHG